MKNLIWIPLTTVFIFCPAGAYNTFLCRGQNQIALLNIGGQRIKVVSFNECNGGVGDEMTNCRPHDYQIPVQDAVIKLRVKEGYLNSQLELILQGTDFEGNDILLYRNYAFQLKIKGNNLSPSIDIRVMAKGTPGRPIEVQRDTLACKFLPAGARAPDLK